MIVGQDWSSSDALSRNPPNLESATLGFTPKIPTNLNLDDLLKRYFGLDRADCYLTNLFPFIKLGNMSAGIPLNTNGRKRAKVYAPGDSDCFPSARNLSRSQDLFGLVPSRRFQGITEDGSGGQFTIRVR